MTEGDYVRSLTNDELAKYIANMNNCAIGFYIPPEERIKIKDMDVEIIQHSLDSEHIEHISF